ncbi:hypothetical protein HBI56_235830 [Parastagonospora nodorum]|nr:hypothetical protein HBH51_240120 [Parastagonospora nodorum]KAH3972404.1 hypothetical protein HBH52_148530 [Parastagonospora nodorum]KAH3990911.1 hypothetical protein HBI10_241690 [Parastagonospora nodorum]KAH4008108.1 hypothetical protein HBI13_241950 [Parastagonospora nodorum]KAH4041469.1 hypothetical protein HBI09_000250 [Parastagonospora nodorum]
MEQAIIYCVRRLYWHPLSKYPGPLLARLTDLYAAYHAWKGDIHIDMWRQHERYGPIIRYSPNKLNFNTAEALKEIYITGAKNFQKSPNYRVLRHGAANTLTMINKEEHARRRRIVSQGLSDAAVRFHEPTLMAHIQKCFALLSGTDEPKNVASWFNYLSFDIMGDVVFGMQYNLLGSTANRAIPDAIEQSNIRVSVLLQSPVLPRVGRIDRWIFPKAIEARDQFLGFVRGLVDNVMKPEDTLQVKTAVVSILKGAHDPITGQKLTSKEILAESTTLCVAGSDTSSTAMSATFFYLANSPQVYQRVQEEVRSLFDSAEDIRIGPKLSKLVYLRACIEEALRMSPPTGASLYREVLRDGATVNGEWFPPTVELGVPIYAIQHNPDYYPSPFEFRPERWLESEGTPKKSIEAARAAFCPFSVGARSCVGKHMAMVELTLAVAYAVYTLEFEFDPEKQQATDKRWGIEDEFRLRDHITASKDGPHLRFEPRTMLKGVRASEHVDVLRPMLQSRSVTVSTMETL